MSARFPRRWRVLLAAIALGLLVWYVGPSDLLATLRRTDIALLVGYLLAFALVPLLFGLQVQVALRIGGARVATPRTVAAALSAWSVGTLTPARAGDLSLAYFLRDEVDEGDTVAIVVVDKLVSIAVLAALACATLPFIPVVYRGLVTAGAAGILAASVLALVLIGVRPADAMIGRVASRLFGARAVSAWARLRALVTNPRFLFWCVAATAVRWSYICAINLIIFRAVAEHPDFVTVVAATAVGRIISLLPVSVGGLGVKEPVQIVIYTSAGVSAEAVVAVSVLGMACGLVIAAVAPLLLPRPTRRAEA